MTKHRGHERIAGHESSKLRVFAIRLPDGTCPALEWLEGLNDRDQPAIGSRLEMLAERGWLRSPDSFNNLDEADAAKGHPRVDEIKHVGQNLRLYVVGFAPGSSVAYVTHGGKKPKKVAREVDRARAIYKEGMS